MPCGGVYRLLAVGATLASPCLLHEGTRATKAPPLQMNGGENGMASREGSGAIGHSSDIGRVLVDEQRNILGKARHKIEHCLSQLTDADMAWRPRAEMNSIAIVVNHLCGNVRQWIM